MWIGGTVSQKDSKHKQLQALVPDGRFRPAHAVNLPCMAAASYETAAALQHRCYCPVVLALSPSNSIKRDA